MGSTLLQVALKSVRRIEAALAAYEPSASPPTPAVPPAEPSAPAPEAKPQPRPAPTPPVREVDLRADQRLLAAVDPEAGPGLADGLGVLVPHVRFEVGSPVGAAIAIAAGATAFCVEALEAAVPVAVRAGEDVRGHIVPGGGVLLADSQPATIAEAVRRLAALAPAGRRVMGQVGRNHHRSTSPLTSPTRP